MDLLGAILDALPWVVAAVLAVASTVALVVYADKLPPWAVALLKVVRGSSLARLLRVGKVAPPVPQPLDPERPEDWPGAVAVDANGTPVQMGRTDAEIEADGPGGA